MYNWRDLILKKIKKCSETLIITLDPDNLLRDEEIVKLLKDLKYEIVPYEDPVVFRYIYERDFREKRSIYEKVDKKLIVQYSGKDEKSIPFDILQRGFVIKLSLSLIFPQLNHSIITKLDRSHLDKLYEAYKIDKITKLSEKKTVNYILRVVFHFDEKKIRSALDFYRWITKIHYLQLNIPKFLIKHIEEHLERITDIEILKIRNIIVREHFFSLLQNEWMQFLKVLTKGKMPALFPFFDKEIYVYIDTFFLEGNLKPVIIINHEELPEKARIGIIVNPDLENKERFEKLLVEINNKISNKHFSYTEWQTIAFYWSQATFLFYKIKHNIRMELEQTLSQLQNQIERKFVDWIKEAIGFIHNTAYFPKPVMIHHIPHYIESKKNKKNALLVIDGLSLDQWFVIKNCMKTTYVFEENIVFAWIPTLTNISRRSLFSGKPPTSFVDPLNLQKEKQEWLSFWKNHSVNPSKVQYKRGIKLTSKKEIGKILDDPKKEILGLIINTVDEFIHHSQIGTMEVHKQIETWMSEGNLEELINKLLNLNYSVYLCSDHGNICANGIGEVREGVLAETQGKRVRIYDSEIFARRFLKEHPNSYEWFKEYLPEGIWAILAGNLYAFGRAGEKIVCHGGISIEEVLIPFIHITKGD